MYAFVLKSIWKKRLLLLQRLETTKVSLKIPGFFASNTGCRDPDFLSKISQISPQTQSYAQSGAEVTCNSTFIPSTSRHESHESNVNMICLYLITEAATTFTSASPLLITTKVRLFSQEVSESDVLLQFHSLR